jgi:hypothetical protein
MHMPQGYQHNEHDIDWTLTYLRHFHPDIATPETAITVLDGMQLQAHKLAAHGEKIELNEAIELVIKSILDNTDPNDH